MHDAAGSRAETVSVRPKMTAELMERTGLSEAILTSLVHRFYEKVRADAVLGPIFAAQRFSRSGDHSEWRRWLAGM